MLTLNMFQFANYVWCTVTATLDALTALKLLRENRDNYDIVITDVWMPEMDGFELLEAIGHEMDVPVICKWATTMSKNVYFLCHIYQYSLHDS